jgi:HEPN domain-containing protein
MVSEEIRVYLKMARAQLEDADLALKNERPALCAFLSALSAENAISALILKLGGKPSKKHRNSLVLYRLSKEVIPPRSVQVN